MTVDEYPIFMMNGRKLLIMLIANDGYISMGLWLMMVSDGYDSSSCDGGFTIVVWIGTIDDDFCN